MLKVDGFRERVKMYPKPLRWLNFTVYFRIPMFIIQLASILLMPDYYKLPALLTAAMWLCLLFFVSVIVAFFRLNSVSYWMLICSTELSGIILALANPPAGIIIAVVYAFFEMSYLQKRKSLFQNSQEVS